jgi:hypothetical protein
LIGAPCLIFDVEMKMLQVCGPLLMVFVLRFSLGMHELQRLVINVDDCLLLENVILPLMKGFYNGIHLFLISVVLMNDI